MGDLESQRPSAGRPLSFLGHEYRNSQNRPADLKPLPMDRSKKIYTSARAVVLGFHGCSKTATPQVNLSLAFPTIDCSRRSAPIGCRILRIWGWGMSVGRWHIVRSDRSASVVTSRSERNAPSYIALAAIIDPRHACGLWSVAVRSEQDAVRCAGADANRDPAGSAG